MANQEITPITCATVTQVPNSQLVQIEPLEPSIGLPGCTYIYAPRGQAGEYSPLAANPYGGCGHGCAYCYVPLVLKVTREKFDAGAIPRQDYIEHLKKDAKKYEAAGITEQVMLSFTTDPYHTGDTTLTRQTLEVLIEHGLGICTLTKGGTRSLRDIDLFRPSRDAFASTLTSLDDSFSKKWERNAALPGDRIKAIQAFHEAGIYTWVSLEPTLDIESSLAIVKETHSYVDLYKVGRVNYQPMTKTIDWEGYTHRMIDLLDKVGAKAYIKKDLQKYLPAGYDNPLRVPQRHSDTVTAIALVSHETPVLISPKPSSGSVYENMDTTKLDDYIKLRVTQAQGLVGRLQKKLSELLPALLEMESRYKKQQGGRTDLHKLPTPGWHDYLESVGMNPSTFRTMKQRLNTATLKQLQNVVDPPQPSTSSGGTSRNSGGSPRIDDNESKILAKAGLRLANALRNPLMSESERIKAATRLAEELTEAAAEGDYSSLVSDCDAGCTCKCHQAA